MEVIVIVSVPAFVVIVTFEPAASVSVSVVVSATTPDCPATDIVLKENSLFSPPAPAETQVNLPVAASYDASWLSEGVFVARRLAPLIAAWNSVPCNSRPDPGV